MACINIGIFPLANLPVHAMCFFFSILFILRLFSSTHFRTFISFQTSRSNETTKIKFEKEIKERAPQCSKKRKKYIHTERTSAKNSRADVFLFNFILCSISFLFTDAFVFASFSYCFSLRFFFGSRPLLSIILVPLYAWLIV